MNTRIPNVRECEDWLARLRDVALNLCEHPTTHLPLTTYSEVAEHDTRCISRVVKALADLCVAEEQVQCRGRTRGVSRAMLAVSRQADLWLQTEVDAVKQRCKELVCREQESANQRAGGLERQIDDIDRRLVNHLMKDHTEKGAEPLLPQPDKVETGQVWYASRVDVEHYLRMRLPIGGETFALVDQPVNLYDECDPPDRVFWVMFFNTILGVVGHKRCLLEWLRANGHYVGSVGDFKGGAKAEKGAK